MSAAGWACAACGLFLTWIIFETLKNLILAETATRLDRLPFAILRLARRRLLPEHRESMHDEEWLPELVMIVRETDGLPITRLVRGVNFAIGLLFAAPRISSLRGPVRQEAPAAPIAPDLLSAARTGDQRAWETLVDRYADLVWTVARGSRLTQDEAADASQATWLRLIEHIDSIRDVDGVETWLAATAEDEAAAVLSRRSGIWPNGVDSGPDDGS